MTTSWKPTKKMALAIASSYSGSALQRSLSCIPGRTREKVRGEPWIFKTPGKNDQFAISYLAHDQEWTKSWALHTTKLLFYCTVPVDNHLQHPVSFANLRPIIPGSVVFQDHHEMWILWHLVACVMLITKQTTSRFPPFRQAWILITCDEKKSKRPSASSSTLQTLMTLPAFLRSAWYLLRSLTHNLHKFKKHWRCWKIEKKASSFRRPSKVQGIDGQGFAALWQLPLAWHRHDSITKSTGSRRPKNGSNTKHRRRIPWASPGIAKPDKIQALMKSILVNDSDGMVEQVCKEKSWAIKWYGKGSVLNKANSQEPAKCSKMKYIGTTVWGALTMAWTNHCGVEGRMTNTLPQLCCSWNNQHVQGMSSQTQCRKIISAHIQMQGMPAPTKGLLLHPHASARCKISQHLQTYSCTNIM